jgi:hypothetical protein
MKYQIALSIILSSLVVLNSCKGEKADSGIDKELYDMAKSTNGFVWYKNSNSLLDKSNGSGHPQAKLRTRYNATAASQLDSEGKILPNAIFPTGSLIVKELHTISGNLDRYALLWKQPDNEFADENGWVWGYINSNGNVAASAEERGTACINCHSQSDNIDYMLMNKFFP